MANFNSLVNRVQLVNAPLMPTFCPSIRAGAYPPLHLASLAAFIRRDCPQVEVEIIDGEVCSLEHVISELKDCLVGVSCNSLTYESALLIAKAAKERGACVVLGGAHPTFAGRHIIRNRPYIDAAVYGDGELALLELVNGTDVSRIPNLIYRSNDAIVTNGEARVRLDDLPLPDYAGCQLDLYFRNYRSLYPDKPFLRPFPTCSSKGCQWRDRTGGGCTFCAIQHIGFRIKSVKSYWKELISLQGAHDADFFWDVSDTFTMQKDWVRQFNLAKPKDAKFNFQVYGRASDIDEGMAGLLADLGVYEVFLGLESGSNETLKATMKGVSVKTNLQAVKNLNREGIRVVISVILGLPHESEDSVRATIHMVETLLSEADLSEINCSILMPLPGSPLMNSLSRRMTLIKGEEDLFAPETLRRLWIESFCKVSYERLIEVQGYMRTLHSRVGTFGLTLSERETQLNPIHRGPTPTMLTGKRYEHSPQILEEHRRLN